MKIALTLALATIALISTLTTVVSARVPYNRRQLAKRAADWTYGLNNAGPQNWAKLDPLYGVCGSGHKQSPIDVAIGSPYVKLQNKTFSDLVYPPIYNVLCGYDGHAVKCEWPMATDNKGKAPASKNENSVVINNKKYNLINFHFHTPSEHRIDNHFSDAELHLVHTSKDGALAVIGVMLEVQVKDNPFFNWVTVLNKKVDMAEKGHGHLVKDKVTGESVPGKEQVKYKVKKVDFSSLLRATGEFTPRWEYVGSLTTPPCTEGVAWNVAKASVRLGLRQYDALVSLESFNSRFIQDRPHEGEGH
ncbi:hypothetical protein BG011_002940 [Mortierella polycephala]|uniref:carbonic anhydrase n=1 Tax=Mortierella polycephala TaxID=41804 RepID=A0A9P6QID6_9FUNG|nr:hypothetical protein BG011_002940 [Mortierella polycephala]